jgi:hypothetical protein
VEMERHTATVSGIMSHQVRGEQCQGMQYWRNVVCLASPSSPSSSGSCQWQPALQVVNPNKLPQEIVRQWCAAGWLAFTVGKGVLRVHLGGSLAAACSHGCPTCVRGFF